MQRPVIKPVHLNIQLITLELLIRTPCPIEYFGTI